jgi:ribosomal protein L11 methyltransferase
MEYLELTVSISPRNPWAEILVSQLADLGFESFVDTETGIQAYAPTALIELENVIAASILSSNTEDFTLEFSTQLIPHQNWNAQWESDFQPVEVEGRLTILAPFHVSDQSTEIEVIIQPQMSFGTGHHQTTWMMSKALLDLDKVPSDILDMGTGTGVLAILAEKLGGKNITAIDIEDWSVENTIENAARNGCTEIHALHGDIDLIEGANYHLVLANINKNILKSHLHAYATALHENGLLMLSGFFETDADELIACCKQEGLQLVKQLTKETWAALILEKIN